MTARPAEEGGYDLVIVGGTAAGLSVAISSRRSGIDEVRVVEPGGTVAFPELVGDNRLDIGYGEGLVAVDQIPADGDSSGQGSSNRARDLVVITDHHRYRARGFTIDRRGEPGNIHYEEYW